jgi:hypothetical protein
VDGHSSDELLVLVRIAVLHLVRRTVTSQSSCIIAKFEGVLKVEIEKKLVMNLVSSCTSARFDRESRKSLSRAELVKKLILSCRVAVIGGGPSRVGTESSNSIP